MSHDFPRAIHHFSFSSYSSMYIYIYITKPLQSSQTHFHSFYFILFYFLSSSNQMEALGVLKFWWNSATGSDVSSYGGDSRRPDDDEETDSDDSFFDLVFTSPDSVAGTKKDNFQFIESPRDVFVSKNDFSDPNPMYPVTLLRSTPKFKILMLGFRKSPKCEKTESNGEIKGTRSSSATFRGQQMPGACRLARGNSLRSQLMMKETSDYETWPEKLCKGSVPKYLKLIRPLYLKVWKRNEKTKFTDSVTPSSSPATGLSPRKFPDGSRMGNLKMASKRLRKSRSASAAVGVVPLAVNRRDDSLMERLDGIQSAVLYCKKSYNSSSSKEFSEIFQTSIGRNSCEEPKRCSI